MIIVIIFNRITFAEENEKCQVFLSSRGETNRAQKYRKVKKKQILQQHSSASSVIIINV